MSPLSYRYYKRDLADRGMDHRVPPIAALAAVGYGMAAARATQVERQMESAAAAEAAELERRRKLMVLADAYGDRSNLEELERAMRVYEAQQAQR